MRQIGPHTFNYTTALAPVLHRTNVVLDVSTADGLSVTRSSPTTSYRGATNAPVQLSGTGLSLVTGIEFVDQLGVMSDDLRVLNFHVESQTLISATISIGANVPIGPTAIRLVMSDGSRLPTTQTIRVDTGPIGPTTIGYIFPNSGSPGQTLNYSISEATSVIDAFGIKFQINGTDDNAITAVYRNRQGTTINGTLTISPNAVPGPHVIVVRTLNVVTTLVFNVNAP